MKYSIALLLSLAVLALCGCTLDPLVDLAIHSTEPTYLTVTEPGQAVTVTIEIRNGVDVRVNGYELKYFYQGRDLGMDHRGDLTSTIEGGPYDDGFWETALGTVEVVVSYEDIIDYAEDAQAEQMTVEIYLHGRDANGNYFKIGKAQVTLYF